jgi:hypothetical protein
MEEEKVEVNYDKEVLQADTVAKYLFAIMNEEEDLDAYYDKTPEEMQNICKLVLARFPDGKVTSYDPAFVTFGQVCLNGYHTFGVDFLKLLVNRKDEIPRICIKGLIDIIENLMIENQNLALQSLPEEERIKIMKSLSNEDNLSDEEFLNKLNNGGN